jgi:hypothetical protein
LRLQTASKPLLEALWPLPSTALVSYYQNSSTAPTVVLTDAGYRKTQFVDLFLLKRKKMFLLLSIFTFGMEGRFTTEIESPMTKTLKIVELWLKNS